MSHDIRIDQPRYTRNAHDTLAHTAAPSWGDTLETVIEFQYQPTFIEALQDQALNPTDQTSSGYATMLSYYSESYIEDNRDILSEDAVTKIALTASLPSVLHAQHEIAHFKSLRDNHVRHLTREEKEYQHGMLKPTTIWYNKQLADYISAHGDEKFTEVARALTEASLDFFPGDEVRIHDEIKQIIRGARNESSADILRKTLPNFFRETTIEEDATSADQMLMFNGREYNVDFKSSTYAVRKIRVEQLEAANASPQEIDVVMAEIDEGSLSYAIERRSGDERSTITLYTGIEDNDYKGYNQLPNDTLDRKSRVMQAQLILALVELGT